MFIISAALIIDAPTPDYAGYRAGASQYRELRPNVSRFRPKLVEMAKLSVRLFAIRFGDMVIPTTPSR